MLPNWVVYLRLPEILTAITESLFKWSRLLLSQIKMKYQIIIRFEKNTLYHLRIIRTIPPQLKHNKKTTVENKFYVGVSSGLEIVQEIH